jgi:hypothetical protein
MFMRVIGAARDLFEPRYDPVRVMRDALETDKKQLFKSHVNDYSSLINKPMRDGKFLLPLAVSLNKKWAVDILIEAKADVNVPCSETDTSTSVYLAARDSHVIILTALLKANADIEGGRFAVPTPLTSAVIQDQPKAVDILLENRANAHVHLPCAFPRGWGELVPLLYFAKSAPVMKSLLDAGVDPSRVWNRFRREFHFRTTNFETKRELRRKFDLLLPEILRKRSIEKAASFVFAWEQQVGALAELPLDMIKVIGKKCLMNPDEVPPIEVKPGDVASWTPPAAGADAGAGAGAGAGEVER